MSDVDPYTYARDHAAGPGVWCVYGPSGFKMTLASGDLQKSEAYAIGKILSGKYVEAAAMLGDLPDRPRQKEKRGE